MDCALNKPTCPAMNIPKPFGNESVATIITIIAGYIKRLRDKKKKISYKFFSI